MEQTKISSRHRELLCINHNLWLILRKKERNSYRSTYKLKREALTETYNLSTKISIKKAKLLMMPRDHPKTFLRLERINNRLHRMMMVTNK